MGMLGNILIKLRLIKEKRIKVQLIHNINFKDGVSIETDANGSKKWYLNGKLHREDGPALEYADGDKEWWLNGEFHREGGPAVEYADGSKSWYLNGKLHREDGPALEYADGRKSWYFHGQKKRGSF